jgi:hypothetical protein
MLANLFKFKKYSTSKGKTIKNSEPADGRQGHSSKTGHLTVVDSSSVGAWVKESAIENADGVSRRADAILKDSKKPCRPKLVNCVQTQSDVATEEKVIVEKSEVPEVTATTAEDSGSVH